MPTVREVFGKMPRVRFSTDSLMSILTSAKGVRVDYDEETDSLVMYFIRESVPTVAVLLGDNFYAMVDPATEELVGLMFGCWKKNHIKDKTKEESQS